jgi:hypothetical protein
MKTLEFSQPMLWPETELPSMSSAQGSRARISVEPESKPEWKAPEAVYGLKLPVLLANYDRASSSWRTSQLCLVALLNNQADGSDVSSGTWPRSGTMRNGIAYLHPPLAPLTDATECGLWPTIVKYDATPDGPNNHYKGLGWSAKHSPTSLWPTPRANDAEKRGNFDLDNPRNGLAAAARKWPTPCARDWRTGDRPESRRARMRTSGEWHSPNLNDVAAPGGHLNPEWTEWLMGFPIGHTELPPSGTL